jgi:curved DNA-binding protein CbpA
MLINSKLMENLLLLHRSSRSGVLRIEKETAKKQLVVKSGLLVLAESNCPDEHLARIMVAMNLLPKGKIDEIASMMKTGMTSEEAAFSAANSDVEVLEKGRREQAVVILASLLGWSDCSMHFYPGGNLIPYRFSLGLPLPEILVLSARRAVSDRVISIPPNLRSLSVSITDLPAEKGLNFPLDSTEFHAYSLFHTHKKTSEVLPLIKAGETSPEEILLRLCILGLIKLDGLPKATSRTSPEEGDFRFPVREKLEEMLIKFQSANLYEILSIPPDATPKEVKTAYYDLAREYHPDHFQSEEFSNITQKKAEQVFAYINDAFTTLGNAEFRTAYDEKRLIKESKVEEALKARAAAGAEEEKMAEVLYREGRVSLSRGDFEKAVDQLKECVWLHPENAKYHHYLGVAQSKMPELRKKAEQHFLKAIELNGMSASSHLELAKLYLKVNLPRKAERQLQQLVSLDPENPYIPQIYAELAKLDSTRIGAFDRATKIFSRK